jgi:RNA polymerase sigma factor (sigma-70 family)
MPTAPLGTLLHHIHRVGGGGESIAASDRTLLQRFARNHDEAAFAELVRRHGALVFAVCRRALGHTQNAEDAFQATFMVLARKAGSERWQETVDRWLYKVAYHMARKLKDAVRRRSQKETLARGIRAENSGKQNVLEFSSILDQELHRLAPRYRNALLLCYLQGKTRDQAARQLAWSLRTLDRRLQQGRELLRVRLVRRGLPLSAALITAGLTQETMAGGVAALRAVATTKAVMASLAATGSKEGLSATALMLANSALKGMLASRVKIAIALAVALSFAATGAGVATCRLLAANDEPRAKESVPTLVSHSGDERKATQNAVPSRLDRYGDPLPPDAISRLGTLRFRPGGFTGFLRYTSDGKSLVSGGRDVHVWDSSTGKELLPFREQSATGSRVTALSPDGTLLIPDTDGIGLWDVSSGRRLRFLGAGAYSDACFSTDGSTVAAVGSISGTAELFDTATSRKIWSWSARENHGLTCVAFANRGELVAVAGWNTVQDPPLTGNSIWLLDAATGKEVRRIDLTAKSPYKMAVSPDGALLGAIYRPESKDHLETNIGVWEVATGRELLHLVPPTKDGSGRQKLFSALIFMPEGKSLLTASGEDGLIEWDLATGQELRRLGRGLTNSQVLAISPDGKTVACALAVIRLIDRKTGAELGPVAGHYLPVGAISFPSDNRRVVTLSGARTIALWDSVTGTEQRRWNELDFDTSSWVAQDGHTVFSMKRHTKMLRVWNLHTGEDRMRIALGFAGQEPYLRAIAPDASVLEAGDYNDDTLHLIDVPTGKRRTPIKNPGLKGFSRIQFASDAKSLTVFCDDHAIQVWDLVKGVKLRQFGPVGDAVMRAGPIAIGSRGIIYTAAVSPDGKWIAYGNGNGYFLLLDALTGRVIRQLNKQPGWISVVAFSPDSRLVAWACWADHLVHLLELATGEERRCFAGHQGSVLSIAFSRDNALLISGSNDTTALVWDLTNRLTAKQGPHDAPAKLDLDMAWRELAITDAANAWLAMQRLVNAPERAVTYIEARVQPARKMEPTLAARLIADLDSNDFAIRERATRLLEEHGEPAVSWCQKALQGEPSPEACRRLEAFVNKQEHARWYPTGVRLRSLRAVELLERIGTAEARSVLESLAAGAAEAMVTQEAKAALERLGKHD